MLYSEFVIVYLYVYNAFGFTFLFSIRWTSPSGHEYFVKYIADRNGYRVVDSNVLPITASGVRANGAQGSFSSEEDVSFDSDENDSFFDDRK